LSIPEAQLETWSHQGSVQQSAATYNTIREVLERPGTRFSGLVDIFLQGSYGNTTNVFADSDVDIVIQYTGGFYHDLDNLPEDQKAAWRAAFPSNHDYTFEAFRTDVLAALRSNYGSAVTPSNKAIKIAAGNGRRSADVVPSFDFRRYQTFLDSQHFSFTPGMTLWAQESGRQVVNYPKLHREHLTAKHQATGEVLKPTIRIYKNLRNALAEAGQINRAVAPSYFVEGMVYNVPDKLFTGSRQDVFAGTLDWLLTANNRSDWITGSRQHYLVRDGVDVCWPLANCGAFLNALASTWNNW
jgi:hypothetical protein